MTPLVLPLNSHEAIIAALVLCDRIGNDNLAVVMVRGYGGASYDTPDPDFTAIYLADYELDEIIDDPDWFADYWDHQLWVMEGAVA